MADIPTIAIQGDPQKFAAEAARLQNPADRANIMSGLAAMGAAPTTPTPQAPQLPTPMQMYAQNAQQAQALRANIKNITQQQNAEIAAAGPAPAPPDQTFKFQPPKESPLVAGLLMAFGAMAGRHTLAPSTAALNNMTGMMQGLHEGDLQAYQMQKTQFDTNYKAAQDSFNRYRDRYNMIMEKHKGDLAAAQADLRDLRTEMGQDVHWAQADRAAQVSDTRVLMMRQSLENSARHMDLTEKLAQSRGGKWMLNPHGAPEFVTPDDAETKDLTGYSMGTGTGGVLMQSKVGNAAAQGNEVAIHLQNMSKLGPVSDFASIHPGSTISDSTRAALVREFTPEQQKMAAVSMQGFGNVLGRLMSTWSGRTGSDALMNDIQQTFAIRKQDSPITAAYKLALGKEEALAVLQSAPPAYAAQMAPTIGAITKAIPWSSSDVIYTASNAGVVVPDSAFSELKDGLSKIHTDLQNSPDATSAASAPPVSALQEGVATHFTNGQTWTLRGGTPVQVTQ